MPPELSPVVLLLQPAQHAVFRGLAVCIRDTGQAGDAVQERLFVRIELVIREGNFPQHLDQTDTALRFHVLGGEACEGKQFMGATGHFIGVSEKLFACGLREPEPALEQALDDCTFMTIENTVGSRGLDQENGHCDA